MLSTLRWVQEGASQGPL